MEPYLRIMTSEGRGAIAVVRVWGRGAVEVVNRVFRPVRGGPIADTEPGRLRLGRAGQGLGDELIAVRIGAAEPVVELQCHGGVAAVRSIVAALEGAGARSWKGGEAGSQRDRLAAQAMVDLPHAHTVRTAEILLDQVHGALGRELDRLRHDLERGSEAALERLDPLIGRGAVGMKLRSGWKVVISGRPNVGKSRLFNAMAGFARAIVDPTPGVTRDVVTFRTAFGGWPVELADTAGIRVSEDAIESQGIARTRREQQEADLVLLLLDRSQPLQAGDIELIEANPDALLVPNKCDLPPAWTPETTFAGPSFVAPVSAESGEGLEVLIAVIVARLVPDPPAPGDAVPFRVDQLLTLTQVREALLADDTSSASRQLAAIDTDHLGPA